MKDADEEKYVFYNLATADFYEASGCLDAIKQYKQGLTKTTMVKNAIIAYSRPFLECKGIYIKKHRLPIKVVPKNHRVLHKKVLHYRNCIIAHTDLANRKPKLVKYYIMMRTEGDYLSLGSEMQVLVRDVCCVVHNMVVEYGKKSNSSISTL